MMLGWNLWKKIRPSSRGSESPSAEDEPMKQIWTSPDCQRRDQIERIQFGRQAANVRGWPKGGGVLIKVADAVDLLHLGASRLEATWPSDPWNEEEENSWAMNLLQIGAKWYLSERDCTEGLLQDRSLTPLEKERLFIGWPSTGGVWILRYTTDWLPLGFGCYSLCVNMDERCEVLRKFGAKFYENPDECFEFSQACIDEYRRQRKNLKTEDNDWTGLVIQ